MAADAATVPVRDPETRAGWAAALQWPERLCPLAEPLFGGPGVKVVRIDGARRWVAVTCEEMGFQRTQLVYLQMQQRTSLLTFTQFDAEGLGRPKRYQSAVLAGSVQFDTAQARLRVVRAYRGIGDCGQLLHYDAGSATARLLSLRERDCPEKPGPEIPPERWPLRKF